MRPLAPVLLGLAASTLGALGCQAQPTEKPGVTADPYGRRADSVVSGVRPAEADTAGVRTRAIPLTLGETPLTLAVHEGGPGSVSYLVVHDDEDTAVEAGLAAAREGGGRLVEVRAQGARYVAFHAAGRDWSVDPNRIFTDAGARRTLTDRAGAAPADVLAAVRRFAGGILTAYEADSARVVVALHNNTEGSYSAASYLAGGSEAAEAAAVHLPEGADPDDFFFTTDRRLYDALVAEGLAVVLQNNEGATDDGSLSVWAGRRGVPYVNVEAQHGHAEAQRAMLHALARTLVGLDLLD
jgi:hypothetical protein